MKLLDNINKPNDIKNISADKLPTLAGELRDFLVSNVSETGGHLASNLGCVELTMALHMVMDFPTDKLIFDVGHQSYVHKILTGRKEKMTTLRSLGGISGFPKTCESDCDAFNTGHSSTSMSAALGMACARKIKGTKERIAAVIGDGAFTGGMVYEALNNMAAQKTSCLIVLNDNEMSIDENVGGMSSYLNKIRVGTPYNTLKSGVEKTILNIPKRGEKIAKTIKKSKDSIKQMLVPGKFFEDLGITYIGPIDGHDIPLMVKTFENAFKLNRPIIVHVKTVKGKGYIHAEKHPAYFHGIDAFNPETGKVRAAKSTSYTTVFAKKLLEIAKSNENVVAVTAAMSKGTGVNLLAKEFPDRVFDVGIAEEHAVTFAAGLASAGMVPVVAIYSSFLQRAYDQILHDVCLQNLHVVFAIDRSGLVGADGETHQGIFDTAFLSHIPNLTIIAPKNRYELAAALEWAVVADGPVAIKYSRGKAFAGMKEKLAPISLGKSEVLEAGENMAILAVGNMVEEAEKLYKKMVDAGKNPTFVNARFVKPIDTELIKNIAANHKLLVTIEEGIYHGGFGAAVCEFVNESGLNAHVKTFAIKDKFVKHGSVRELRAELEMDADAMFNEIMSDV